MTIRKNFIFDEEIAQHLEELAAKQNITQTQLIKNMIEEKYEEISVQEKLEAFRSIIPMPAGSLVGKSIQSAKEEMASKI
jgi:predicted DNA-binding ribbon-helix-helix protein